MESLASDRPRRAHVVFVTANLNAGGAQRSLVNLAKALCGKMSFEVVVAGPSSSDVFRKSLEASGIKVTVSGLTRDCFDHAEALMAIAAQTGCKVMCFWNMDPKVKLLLAKALPRAIDVVDISPGGYAFEEMEQELEFQDLVGFHQVDYYRRLSKLVLKFDGDAPSYVSCETMVIRNGVPAMFDGDIERSHPSVVINGRIAPSKFLLEIVQAMSAVWSQAPEVRLHILGSVEERHRNYAEDVICAAQAACGEEVDSRVTFHGPVYDLGSVARPGDIAVVLGEHQGCPNAVLEAMSLGMAVVANDSGGTREMVKDGETGLLLPSTSVAQLSSAILRLVQDAGCRLRLAEEGRQLVRRDFSMERMARSYGDFFQSMFTTDTSYEADHRR